MDEGSLYLEREDPAVVSRAVETAVRSALARRALTEDTKSELLFDAKRLALGIRLFRNAPNRGPVYRLVLSALFVGLRASLQTDEVDRLSAQVRSEMGRAGGKKSGSVRKASRPWVLHATRLAIEACKRDPIASHETVAGAISDCWKLADVKCPGIRTLAKFVSDLRSNGQLPHRSGSLPKRTPSGG
jgi:hypothetical protein